MAAKLSDRLLARLRAEEVVPTDITVEMQRLNPSRSQRVVGAWSWMAAWRVGDVYRTAGSQWPMATVLSWPTWTVSVEDWGDIQIDPPPADPTRMLRRAVLMHRCRHAQVVNGIPAGPIRDCDQALCRKAVRDWRTLTQPGKGAPDAANT